eukprot:jgi/Botrbrau1/4891/Bobra.118_1s0005.1
MRALGGIGIATSLKECPFEGRRQTLGLPQFTARPTFQHYPSFKRNHRLNSHVRVQGLRDRVKSPGEPADGQHSSNGNGGGENSVRQPPADVLSLWRKADAVCFDVDCTITVNDSLDLLADFLGKGDEVAEITHKAMNGTLSLEAALEQRLKIINCTPDDLRTFIVEHPPQSRLVPGIVELINALKARGKAIFLISGGFREITLPIARYLGVPVNNVFANRMNWQVDDETGLPTKLVGFDPREDVAHQGGKPAAISRLRNMYPYETIAMVGDGITDLEAVQISGGADLFIGFGGVVKRPIVMEGADWFVDSWQTLLNALTHHKVAFIGSGAWACTAARIVAANIIGADDPTDDFDDTLKMWVYEEEFKGRKLTESINETHINEKYLPGVFLGENVVACPSLEETVKGADVLIFCAPHQFVHGICKQLIGKIDPDAVAISLTKGMRVRPDGPQLISQMVRKYLGIDCSVLMGANIAKDIAAEELSEATIGYSVLANGELFKRLFQRPYFYVQLVPDVAGAEMAGTLKNIVALAAGFVDGLGLGPNSKAAIMREGLFEMRVLAERIYPTVRDLTFFESCGVADLIATCYGGRNRLVAEAYCKSYYEGQIKSFEDLERDLLAGQKLQGVLTSNEVQEVLRIRKWEDDFPLFTTVNKIVNQELEPADVTHFLSAYKTHLTLPSTTSEDDLSLPPLPAPVGTT